MSKINKSNGKEIELREIDVLVKQRKLEILQKQKTAELVKTWSKNNNADDTTNLRFSNDGSFLENFKKITEQAKQSLNSTNNLHSIESTSVNIPNFIQPTFTTSTPHLLLNSLPPPLVMSSTALQSIHTPQPIELNEIPSPRELDLSAIPKPILKLEEIRMPETPKAAPVSFKDKNIVRPSTVEQLVDLVADKGDIYEAKLLNTQTNEMQSSFGFLFERGSIEYNNYRQRVLEKRLQIYDPSDVFVAGPSVAPSVMKFGFEGHRPKVVHMMRNDDSDSTNSDTEFNKITKERNLCNLKRKALTSRTRKQQDLSTTDSSDNDEEGEGTRFYSDNKSQVQSPVVVGEPARPPKKKSRWGPSPSSSSSSSMITTIVQTNASVAAPVASASGSSKPAQCILTAVQRTDPALLAYARQNFGSAQLTEEDWSKAEEHYKINLLYQDMVKKRQELDFLAKNNKFKYEYDTDEDVSGGGTWEHKLRCKEMEATTLWSEALNKHSEGKHHIGDFLPPEELKKFMEKYDAQKNNRQPDISDYKEYKLKEDNIGFKMLQKMGWTDGQGLGADESGIVDPVNKAVQRENNQGLGVASAEAPDMNDNEYDAYRKRMMMAYRFRPNPLNNPRRAYY